MDQSLYEQIGGEKTVEKATYILYANILQDKRIRDFFKDVDIEKQRRKMTAFLTFITGGPSLYLGKTMRRAHTSVVEKGLSDEHVDAMMECVSTTLHALDIDDEKIKTVIDKIEEHRDDVLNR